MFWFRRLAGVFELMDIVDLTRLLVFSSIASTCALVALIIDGCLQRSVRKLEQNARELKFKKRVLQSSDFIKYINFPTNQPEYGSIHLFEMVEKMLEMDISNIDQHAKANRWLGYLQAAIVIGGAATLEDMKSINR